MDDIFEFKIQAFLFFLDEQRNVCVCVYKKEICKPEYRGHIQWALSGRFDNERNIKPLSLSLNMIPTNLQGIEPSFVYVPTQAKRPHRNNHFNLFSGCSTFPNALRFPSFHKVQKMHIGVICQTFFRFFWTKEPCQIKGVSLTMEGPTQTIPNRKNKSCHRTLDMMQ